MKLILVSFIRVLRTWQSYRPPWNVSYVGDIIILLTFWWWLISDVGGRIIMLAICCYVGNFLNVLNRSPTWPLNWFSWCGCSLFDWRCQMRVCLRCENYRLFHIINTIQQLRIVQKFNFPLHRAGLLSWTRTSYTRPGIILSTDSRRSYRYQKTVNSIYFDFNFSQGTMTWILGWIPRKGHILEMYPKQFFSGNLGLENSMVILVWR